MRIILIRAITSFVFSVIQIVTEPVETIDTCSVDFSVFNMVIENECLLIGPIHVTHDVTSKDLAGAIFTSKAVEEDNFRNVFLGFKVSAEFFSKHVHLIVIPFRVG